MTQRHLQNQNIFVRACWWHLLVPPCALNQNCTKSESKSEGVSIFIDLGDIYIFPGTKAQNVVIPHFFRGLTCLFVVVYHFIVGRDRLLHFVFFCEDAVYLVQVLAVDHGVEKQKHLDLFTDMFKVLFFLKDGIVVEHFDATVFG
jgi:hypothetical protein